MAVMALVSLACLWRIRPEDIDHDMARGLDANAGHRVPTSLWKVLRGSPALMTLAVVMMLFHLGNAAMLPLLGQAAMARAQLDPSLFTALTVMVAQLVMIPVALLAGGLASRHGYALLVTLALLALPLRGLVAGCWDSAWALIPVQVLDGVGAGLLGVALPGLVARLLHGSGHVNIGLGAVMTIQGVGAALSPALAGAVAARYGYGMAFLALSALAALALLLWLASGAHARSATPHPPQRD